MPRLPRLSAPALAFLRVLPVLGLLSLAGTRAEAGLFNPETFTLDNGMQVVVIPDHRAPVVVHMVWYRIGAADEQAGESGLAHFFEHLMFKGTEKIPPGEFSKIVAANGGRDNAFTSYDYTAYFQVIARDRLPLVMEMESDRMTNLRLNEKDVLTERDVVLAERRQRTDSTPQGQFGEQVRAALYLAHPYGRPVIGWQEEIERLNLADAMRFYRHYYAPNNAILIVAGDITAADLKPLAEKFYGAIPANPELRARPEPVEPPHRAARRVEASDPRVAVPSWQRLYIADSTGYGDRSRTAPLEFFSRILGGGSTGRLYRELVIERKLAVNAGAWYSGVDRGPGSLGIYATPAEGVDPAAMEAAIDKVIGDLLRDGPTAEEVERARTGLLAEAVYARDSLQTGARIFGNALAAGLTVEEVEAWPERVRAVTAETITAAGRATMRIEGSVTALLKPETRS
ncbi:MAG: pitrilysin family protein [Pseudomonadota bacterium]|nr:pitrilysin family protein [Pseudomonadota bacterium]